MAEEKNQLQLFRGRNTPLPSLLSPGRADPPSADTSLFWGRRARGWAHHSLAWKTDGGWWRLWSPTPAPSYIETKGGGNSMNKCCTCKRYTSLKTILKLANIVSFCTFCASVNVNSILSSILCGWKYALVSRAFPTMHRYQEEKLPKNVSF